MNRRRRRGGAQEGSAVVLAIFVLFLLSSAGIGLLYLAESDMKMNQAGLRAKKSFFVAEAGLEKARNVLKINNSAGTGTNPTTYTDELATAAGSGGAIEADPSTIAPVWNAAGQVTGFTGFGNDVPLVPFTAFGGGWYEAFLVNDPIDGWATPADSNSRAMIVAIGATTDRSVQVVQAIVRLGALPSLPATITMLGPTPSTFAGGPSSTKSYTGNDCAGTGYPGTGLSVPTVGTIGSASDAAVKASVGTANSYTSNGLTGSNTVDDITTTTDSPPPWNVIASPALTDCNSLKVLGAQVKAAADNYCTTASPCSNWASTTLSTVTYVEGDATPNSGMGILWVTGTLHFGGGTSWVGPIFVVGTGQYQMSGGGNGSTWGGIVVANITGPDGIYGTADDCTGPNAGFSPASFNVSGGGNHDYAYCSAIDTQALSGLPAKVLDFRQR